MKYISYARKNRDDGFCETIQKIKVVAHLRCNWSMRLWWLAAGDRPVLTRFVVGPTKGKEIQPIEDFAASSRSVGD